MKSTERQCATYATGRDSRGSSSFSRWNGGTGARRLLVPLLTPLGGPADPRRRRELLPIPPSLDRRRRPHVRNAGTRLLLRIHLRTACRDRAMARDRTLARRPSDWRRRADAAILPRRARALVVVQPSAGWLFALLSVHRWPGRPRVRRGGSDGPAPIAASTFQRACRSRHARLDYVRDELVSLRGVRQHIQPRLLVLPGRPTVASRRVVVGGGDSLEVRRACCCGRADHPGPAHKHCLFSVRAAVRRQPLVRFQNKPEPPPATARPDPGHAGGRPGVPLPATDSVQVGDRSLDRQRVRRGSIVHVRLASHPRHTVQRSARIVLLVAGSPLLDRRPGCRRGLGPPAGGGYRRRARRPYVCAGELVHVGPRLWLRAPGVY